MPDAGDGSAAPGSAKPDRARRSRGRPVLWAGLIGLLAGGVLAAAVALTDWPRADAARGVHAAGRRMLALEHVRIDTTDFSVGDRAWFVYQAPDRLDMHIHSRGRWTRLLRIGRIGYRQLPGETTFQRRVLYLLASPVPRNFFRGIATATRVRRRGSLYLFDVEAPYLASSLVEAR